MILPYISVYLKAKYVVCFLYNQQNSVLYLADLRTYIIPNALENVK